MADMELFLAELRKLWNGWNIRGAILLSLILQIILIIFGSRRKYMKGIWIRIIVWSAYTAAEWLPTFALSILANNQGNSEDNDLPKTGKALQAFWAPFLLMHLGGSDTITAYSLEDNELLLRHIFEFIVQGGLAFYVILQSWRSRTILTFLAVPVLITGIIKYGERIWILWSSSSKQLKEYFMSHPDPSPDVFITDSLRNGDLEREMSRKDINPKANYILQAYFLFNRSIYLFAGLILGFYERLDCYLIVQNCKSAKEAFDIVSTELGFLYDKLCTKATVIYSRWGIFFRCINFFSSFCVSVAFLMVNDKNAYSEIDIRITYLLLVWAVVHEVYSLISLLYSDWTRLWLSKLKTEDQSHSCDCASCSSNFSSTDSKKWSGSMGQYSLLNYCLKDDNAPFRSIGDFMYQLIGKYQDLSWKDVNDDLKEIIFKQIKEKGKQIEGDHFSIELCKNLLCHRGDHALENKGCLEQFRWSTTGVEFDESLLLWHIATDICFCDSHGDNSDRHPNCSTSKYLSDYMLYLLIFCPSMLPKGIGELRYRDTCKVARELFEQNKSLKSSKSKVTACKALLQAELKDDSSEEKKGDKCQSVLLSACRLAKQLQEWECQSHWRHKSKWKLISEVWVELLMYAASNCEWKEHGQQLRRGGELLTHVRLLMVHLGLSEQYQIRKKHILYHAPKSSRFHQIDQRLRHVLKHPLSQCFLCCCCCPCFCFYHCCRFSSKVVERISTY